MCCPYWSSLTEKGKSEGAGSPILRPSCAHVCPNRRLEKSLSLGALVRGFVQELRAEFVGEIERDPRAFRKRVIHLFRVALPVDRGRPRLETVTRAFEMRRHGKDWRVIYPACIPRDLLGDSRILAQSRLRSAVRARRRASKEASLAPTACGRSHK